MLLLSLNRKDWASTRRKLTLDVEITTKMNSDLSLVSHLQLTSYTCISPKNSSLLFDHVKELNMLYVFGIDCFSSCVRC